MWNSEVWRWFPDGLGMCGLAWSGDTCKGGGKKDAELYVSILEDNLLSSIEYSEIPRGGNIF